MICTLHGLHAEAVDYELLWLGTDEGRAAVGAFSDFHLSHLPVPRIVTGYLGAAAANSSLVLTSHGHRVGSLEYDTDRCRIVVQGPVEVDGRVGHARAAGLALVADAGNSWHEGHGGIVASGAGGWGFTIVHGPAEAKVQNRIRLLESLMTLGGRRG